MASSALALATARSLIITRYDFMRMTPKQIQEAVQDLTSRSCLSFLYTKKGETYVSSDDEVLCQIAHLVLYSAHTPSILDVLSSNGLRVELIVRAAVLVG